MAVTADSATGTWDDYHCDLPQTQSFAANTLDLRVYARGEGAVPEEEEDEPAIEHVTLELEDAPSTSVAARFADRLVYHAITVVSGSLEQPPPGSTPDSDPAVSLGLEGTAEEDTAAAKMQAVHRGRKGRAKAAEAKSAKQVEKELARAKKKFVQMDKDGSYATPFHTNHTKKKLCAETYQRVVSKHIVLIHVHTYGAHLHTTTCTFIARTINPRVVRNSTAFSLLIGACAGNGVIEGEEIDQLATWLFQSFHPGGEAVPPEVIVKEAAKLKKRLDKDCNGKLDFEEFAAWFTRTCESIARFRRQLAQRKAAGTPVKAPRPSAAPSAPPHAAAEAVQPETPEARVARATDVTPAQELALVPGEHAKATSAVAVRSEPTAPSEAEDVPDNVRAVFARVDRNGDEQLTRAELIRALRKDPELQVLLGLPARVGDEQRDVFESVFQGMDTDDDRSITVEELALYLRRQGRGSATTTADSGGGSTVESGGGTELEAAAAIADGRPAPLLRGNGVAAASDGVVEAVEPGAMELSLTVPGTPPAGDRAETVMDLTEPLSDGPGTPM